MESNNIERIIQVKNEIEKEVPLNIINHEKIKLSRMKNEDPFIGRSMINKILNSSRMIMHIFNLNRRLDSLNEIQKYNELKYGYLTKIKNDLNRLETEIDLFKAKILSLFKKEDRYKQRLKLLFNRHFSDLIIKILIKKYHSYFKRINLDLQIAHELINYFQKNFDLNNRDEIIQTLQNEIFVQNKGQKEGVKNYSINISKDKNEIKFIQNISLGNVNIDSTELNFILELFFYIKKKGNQIGHPNLEQEKNINLINEENGFKRIDNIMKDENFTKSEEEMFQNLEKIINSKVKDKMEQIKSEIKNYLINRSTKKELNINEMMNFMLLGKINEIWTNQSEFFRELMINIDNIIKEDCEINWPSIESDMMKLKEYKEIINKFKKEKIIEQFDLNIDTKEYDNLKYLISNEFNKINKDIKGNIIKKLCKINYSTFIGNIYDKIIDGKFPTLYNEHEYLEIIYSIAIPFIIELEENNYEILKNNLINQFQEVMIMLNIKVKTEKILNICQDYFKEEESTEDYITKIKKICLDKKDNDYKGLQELDIDIDSIIFYLKKLIGKENNYLIKKDIKKEKFSLKTLLYFYQNELE